LKVEGCLQTASPQISGKVALNNLCFIGSNFSMTQKWLTQPVRLLLIAFVAVPAMTVTSSAATPRVSIRPVQGKRAANTANLRARQDIYLFQGIDRWGLNE
jgi:hypothetical protein